MEFKCVYCQGSGCETIHVKDAKDGLPLDISACLTCGLTQLFKIPDDDVLSAFYATDYRVQYGKETVPKPKHIYRAGRVAANRLKQMAPYVPKGQKHLDIGAGGGEFVYLSGRYGLNSLGIDPASDYLEFGRDAYGVNLEVKEIVDLNPDEKFDVITMFHVLEHLAHPIDVLEQVHGLLAEDGIFVVEVPNFEAKNAAPTNTYFKAHITYFTTLSLELMFSSLFKIELIENERALFAIFRKKEVEAEASEIREKSVALSLSRLKEKTVIEYALNGGVGRVGINFKRMNDERKHTKGREPRAILDLFLPIS